MFNYFQDKCLLSCYIDCILSSKYNEQVIPELSVDYPLELLQNDLSIVKQVFSK